jgi:hypothetical protein
VFESFEELSIKLAATGYFVDPIMTQVVFLAAKLQKPLLLEGPAGSGKFGTCCPSKAAKTNSPQSVLIAPSASTSCSATLINPAFCSRSCIRRKPNRFSAVDPPARPPNNLTQHPGGYPCVSPPVAPARSSFVTPLPKPSPSRESGRNGQAFPTTRSHSSTFVTTGHASHTKSKPSCIASTRSGAPALAGDVPGCRVGLGHPDRAHTALSATNQPWKSRQDRKFDRVLDPG